MLCAGDPISAGWWRCNLITFLAAVKFSGSLMVGTKKSPGSVFPLCTSTMSPTTPDCMVNLSVASSEKFLKPIPHQE